MAVTRFEVTSRSVAFGGAGFGKVGQFELIRGILHMAVDPKHPDSQLIADIDLAPRGEDGKVPFASDVQVLTPARPAARGTLLLDVVNRGLRTLPGFNSPPPGQDNPAQEPQLGNGFLQRRGFTLVFCGWQTDVPKGRLSLHAPEALDANGHRLTGQAYQQFDVSHDCYDLLLSDREHQPQSAADIYDTSAILTRREWPDGPPSVIPRNRWLFAQWVDGHPIPGPNHICMPEGFQTGLVYEVIYDTIGAPVIGLGHLALRDCASFFRYGTEAEGNPCTGLLDHAYAYGASQSGRFLREFLYLGLNRDEAGRLVYDGAMPHIAASRFGEFNFRFGQPSSNNLRSVGSRRALAYSEQTDPVSGDADGLLRRLEAKDAVPKIIATNSGVEYWWGGASLTHTDAAGSEDLEPPSQVRIYHISGAKHGPGALPLTDTPMGGPRQQHFSNTLDYRPVQRALLVALDRWVREGVEPPPSNVPRIADGTAVRREHLADFFRSIPGIGFMAALPVRRRLDFGPGMAKGVPRYPAKEGEPYGVLVSAVDSDGNEIAGLRMADIRVPLGTHTGWTMRHPDIGGTGNFMPLQGAGIPFARTKRQRLDAGDHRPSIEERYTSLEDYLSKMRRAVEDLVSQGALLAEDTEAVLEGAAARWDAFLKVAQTDPVLVAQKRG